MLPGGSAERAHLHMQRHHAHGVELTRGSSRLERRSEAPVPHCAAPRGVHTFSRWRQQWPSSPFSDVYPKDGVTVSPPRRMEARVSASTHRSEALQPAFCDAATPCALSMCRRGANCRREHRRIAW